MIKIVDYGKTFGVAGHFHHLSKFLILPFLFLGFCLGLSTEILAQGSAEEKFKTAITENLSKDPLAKSQWEMLLSLGWDIKLDRRIKDPAHIRDIGLLPLNASYKKLMESHYYPSKMTITVNPHFSLKKIARELSNKILTQATLLPVTASTAAGTRPSGA